MTLEQIEVDLRRLVTNKERLLHAWPTTRLIAVCELAKEALEARVSFELRWDAGQRAIKRWQDATGHTEVWPDHADLCVWLLEERDKDKARIAELEVCR